MIVIVAFLELLTPAFNIKIDSWSDARGRGSLKRTFQPDFKKREPPIYRYNCHPPSETKSVEFLTKMSSEQPRKSNLEMIEAMDRERPDGQPFTFNEVMMTIHAAMEDRENDIAAKQKSSKCWFTWKRIKKFFRKDSKQ